MKLPAFLALSALAITLPGAARAQLVDQQVDGTQRVCFYRAAPVGDERRELRIGIAEACPASPPIGQQNLVPPPTARLVSSRVEDGRRICTYGQLGHVWAYQLALSAECPLAVGMMPRRTDERD